MELLEGRTLHRALREEAPLSSERTMHIARQICRSLREAHNLGVIHRDLKPANVYLLHHGDERDVVKVLDFGLVKNLEDKGEELTQTGLFMGSPKYMSPEQIRGERCDGRVDVYALGVLMYEMLTGKVPFDRPNSVNILMAHIQEDVPAMLTMNPNVRVSAALEGVVRKCMAKSADARFATMEEVLSALKQIAGLNTTLSGEVRVSEFADLSRSMELPLTPGVQLRGDLLSGGTPSITRLDSSTFGPINTSATPANGQTALDSSGSQANPRSSRSKRVPLIVSALVAALALGGFFAVNAGSSSSSQNGRAKAKQLERAAAIAAAPPPATPAASEPVHASAEPPSSGTAMQGTVMVSLRSTPPGAMVTVGEKEYGPTPTQVEWTGEEATFGREVTFRFQRKGFRDLTVTRQIRGDKLEIDAPPMDPIASAPTKRAERSEPPPAPAKLTAPITPLKGYKAEPY
jgi:serine/threonine-protein kinase